LGAILTAGSTLIKNEKRRKKKEEIMLMDYNYLSVKYGMIYA